MKFEIKKAVRADNRDLNPDDILAVKRGLNLVGYYEKPSYGITEYPDAEIFKSIKAYQKDRKLKIDGIINPDGETIRQINKDVRISVRTPTMWCSNCGGPHGGSKGSLCPDCAGKA